MIAISTACKEALIAIDINGKRNFASLDASCKHSENVLFAVDKMLEEIGHTVHENDEYAVIVGPGSFTGLRIGISLIKGLNAGDNKENVVALTTFDLMAYSYIKKFRPQTNFTCAINGLSGYYFVCTYSVDGQKLGEEKMVEEGQLADFDNLVGLKEDGVFENQISPTAEDLLEIANVKAKNNEKVSAQNLVPLYLRKSQAEVGIESKKNN